MEFGRPARPAAAGLQDRPPWARLADATLQAYRSRLNAKLDALLHIIPTHAGGEKLKAAIEACRHSLFVFLANRAVPPTNRLGQHQALLGALGLQRLEPLGHGLQLVALPHAAHAGGRHGQPAVPVNADID